MKDIIKNIYNNVFFRIILFILLFLLTIFVTIILFLFSTWFDGTDSLLEVFAFFALILSNLVLFSFNLDVTKFYEIARKYIFVIIPILLLVNYLFEYFDINKTSLNVPYFLLFAFVLIWIFGFVRKKLQREVTKQIIIFICFILTLFLYLPFGIFVQGTDLSKFLFLYSFIFIEKNIIWILTARLFGINLFENIVQRKAIITYLIFEYLVYFLYIHMQDSDFSNVTMINENIFEILQFVFPTLIAIYLIIYTIFFVIEKRKQKELSDARAN